MAETSLGTIDIDKELDICDDSSVDAGIKESGSSKRPNENNSSSETEPPNKRKRNQTVFYGDREDDVNDDDLFARILKEANDNSEFQSETTQQVSENVSQSNENQKSTQSAQSSVISSMTPAERSIFDQLVDIAADIAVVKKRMIEIELKMTANQNSIPTVENKDRQKILELGLPLKCAADLKKFEENLKKSDFETEIVSELLKALPSYYLIQYTKFDISYSSTH